MEDETKREDRFTPRKKRGGKFEIYEDLRERETLVF